MLFSNYIYTVYTYISLGVNDDTIHCRTYLGHVLSVGDAVLGLDLRNSNVNNPELEKLSLDKVGKYLSFFRPQEHVLEAPFVRLLGFLQHL